MMNMYITTSPTFTIRLPVTIYLTPTPTSKQSFKWSLAVKQGLMSYPLLIIKFDPPCTS